MWEKHQLPNISRSWPKCQIGSNQVEVLCFWMEGRRHHSQLSWLIVWASVSQKMDESTMTFSFYVHSMQECYSVLFLDQCNNVMTCTVVLLFLETNEIQYNVLYLNNFWPSQPMSSGCWHNLILHRLEMCMIQSTTKLNYEHNHITKGWLHNWNKVLPNAWIQTKAQKHHNS